MDFKSLFADDRAVSPVIGVILMVAITVILAAVIGTFVLGLGSGLQQTSPQATFGFEVTNSQNNLTVTHETGDGIPSSQLNLSATTQFDAVTGSGTNTTSLTFKSLGINGDVTAGDSVEVSEDPDDGTDGTFAGETFRVVWFSAEGDNSATLSKFEVPS